MSETLPPRANIDWYRKLAKKKLELIRAKTPSVTLAAAQRDVARAYGFPSWRKLKAAIDALKTPPIDASLVTAFAEALNRDRGDVVAIRQLLDAHPQLAHCRPWQPQWQHTAIEAAAHLCVWHRPKQQQIVRLLLERGATCDFPTVARAGLLDEVKRRLDADPSLINLPDTQGRTAIYRAACLYGAFPDAATVVNELVDRGAAIDVFTAASWLMIDRLRSMLAAEPLIAIAIDADGLTALHWVTRTDPVDSRQAAAARLLLDAGADPNAEAATESGMRPLHCAAEWASSTELAGLLIDRGADVNAASSQSPWTPLDYAIDRNRTPMRDYLRTRGAKTREELAAVDDVAIDTFLKAVHRGDLPAVTAVLDASPDFIHHTGKHPQWGGRPQALHIAIETGNAAMFDTLLARGANAGGNNALYDHWSPLMLAVHWKRDAMRESLLRRINHVSLIDALMMGDDAAALRILRSGAIMLQRPMPNDATMLHFCRTAPAAARLIELGVPIGTRDKYGRTPLDSAAAASATAAVDLLIARGANASPATFARLGNLPRLKQSLGAQSVDRATFVAAIESGKPNVVKWLISRGVDVTMPDEKNTTFLHLAAFAGNLEIVKLLVRAGADVRAEDDQYGATPANWAKYAADNLPRDSCVEVAIYLEKQMAKKWSVETLPTHRTSHKIAQWKPIMDAAFVGDAKEVAKLLDGGADPNVISSTPHRHRPLHRAIERKKTAPRGEKHLVVAKLLLDRGADPHLRATHGMHTALQLAAIDSPIFVPLLRDRFKPLDFWHAIALGDATRVAALLKRDLALASRRDANEWLPLHYAAASSMYQLGAARATAQLRITKLLLDAGADPNGTYRYGQWPISVLFYACGYHNNPALTELLIRAGANACDNESVYHASDERHAACLDVIERLTDPQALAAECTHCLRTQLQWGHTAGMPWLLAHGADPAAAGKDGRSAVDIARAAGKTKVVAILLASTKKR